MICPLHKSSHVRALSEGVYLNWCGDCDFLAVELTVTDPAIDKQVAYRTIVLKHAGQMPLPLVNAGAVHKGE